MRTKTLLCTAAVMAAGLGASMAQTAVYSVNAVGYVNLNIGVGFTMIANPLIATNNTLGALLPTVPNFSNFYKWDDVSQSFIIATYFFTDWDQASITLNPGEGGFILTDTTFTATFVGDVSQGNLTNRVSNNYSIRASKVPQAGTATSLGLTPFVNNFDNLYKWNIGTQSYDIFTLLFGNWDPSDPNIGVGESFFLNTAGAYNWTRSFSVN